MGWDQPRAGSPQAGRMMPFCVLSWDWTGSGDLAAEVTLPTTDGDTETTTT